MVILRGLGGVHRWETCQDGFNGFSFFAPIYVWWIISAARKAAATMFVFNTGLRRGACWSGSAGGFDASPSLNCIPQRAHERYTCPVWSLSAVLKVRMDSKSLGTTLKLQAYRRDALTKLLHSQR